MPTKRDDETQDAFVIRCVRDDEAEACIETVISTEIRLVEDGYEHPQITGAIIKALRERIETRSKA